MSETPAEIIERVREILLHECRSGVADVAEIRRALTELERLEVTEGGVLPDEETISGSLFIGPADLRDSDRPAALLTLRDGADHG